MKKAAWLFFALLGLLALGLMSADQRYIAVPGFACIFLVLWLWVVLWTKDGKVPLFDVGAICALVTLLYTVFPLLNYWSDGLQFGPLSDPRLQAYRISPAELGAFHLRHTLYLAAFVVAYLHFRKKGAVRPGNVRIANRAGSTAVLIGFLLLTGYFILLQVYTGLNLNTSYAPDAYAEYVATLEKLPLLLLQVSFKFSGILFVFKLALLLVIISKFNRLTWRVILFGWIALEILQAVIIRGARTGLILFLMAAILCYHRMVRPLTAKVLLPIGAVIFAGFLFLGVFRSYSNVSEMSVDFLRNRANYLTTTNEFQALLGTEFDVYQRKLGGARIPWYVYINDVSAILPPQQLLPFEKIAAYDWYVREIGLGGSGMGFMWGVISQSIVGLDWLEIALRGAVLGLILAWFHRWYIEHQSGFIETLLYIFICVKVYYTFRDTTFSLLANLVWEVIPFYLLFRLGTAVLASRVRSGYRPVPVSKPNA